ESDSTDVSAKHYAGRFNPRIKGLRPGATIAPRRLVAGPAASSRYGHYESRGWASWHLRRPDTCRYGRGDDSTGAERPCLVQGRIVARQYDHQCARILVHVVV